MSTKCGMASTDDPDIYIYADFADSDDLSLITVRIWSGLDSVDFAADDEGRMALYLRMEREKLVKLRDALNEALGGGDE